MKKELSLFQDFIKFKNLRMTSQRRLILEEFLSMEGHFDIGDLLEKTKKSDPNLGVATLYRNMILLVEAGLATEHKDRRGKKSFEKHFGKKHHDHLICIGCDTIVEFERPMIEKLQREVAEKNNFFLHFHRMELYGFCPKCS